MRFSAKLIRNEASTDEMEWQRSLSAGCAMDASDVLVERLIAVVSTVEEIASAGNRLPKRAVAVST